MAARLVADDPSLWLSRSWTTRPRRLGESDAAYLFVDDDEFMAHVDAGGFLEWTTFAGNGALYGTPWPEAPDGSVPVLEIDVDGARQVRERMPETLVILLVPPSPGELERRLQARGDDEAAAQRRLALAEQELEEGRRLADHVVVNDDLSRAAEEVAGMIERFRTFREGPTPRGD